MAVYWLGNAAVISGASVTSVTTPALTEAVEGGDFLCVTWRCSVSTAGITISDNVNPGTYASAFVVPGTRQGMSYFWNSLPAAPGTLTVTMTNDLAGVDRVSVDHFRGVRTDVDPFGAATGSAGTSGTTYTGTSIPVSDGQLVVCGAATPTNLASATPGTIGGTAALTGGFASTANGTVYSEYVLSGVAGLDTASFTYSATAIFTGVTAAFAQIPTLSLGLPSSHTVPILTIQQW